jgi:hemerythrin-like domain-containing protein
MKSPNRTEQAMTTIRTFMTDDHRHCDDLFAAAEQAMAQSNAEATRAAFAHFHQAMLAHFDAEEKTLFPTFEAKTGMSMGPTQVMRMEHTQMRALMNDAVDALEAGNLDDYLGQAETLLIMMQQHNMKEENILYPMCDQHLADELPAVLERLETELSEA